MCEVEDKVHECGEDYNMSPKIKLKKAYFS